LHRIPAETLTHEQKRTTEIRIWEIGFSLAEIAELLSLRSDPGAGCVDICGRTIEKRNSVQVKLDRLLRMQDALDELIARCPSTGGVKACTILDVIERGIDDVLAADRMM